MSGALIRPMGEARIELLTLFTLPVSRSGSETSVKQSGFKLSFRMDSFLFRDSHMDLNSI